MNDKYIEVIVNQEEYLTNGKWAFLKEILEDGKDEGIVSSWCSLSTWKEQRVAPDGFIFVDVIPPTTKFPFVLIESLDASDDHIMEKVQELAGYLFNPESWIPPVDEINPLEESVKIHEAKEVDIKDLGYNISKDQIEKLKIQEFVINIDGKDVKVSKADIITMGKICNIIDKFGYKVKKVML